MFTTPPRLLEAFRVGLFAKESRQSNKKHNQSGRSMIEMLGVLAIVGVLSAGGIAGYSMAMQSYKTNQLVEKVNLIAMRARGIYKGDYTGISGDNLINSGKITDVNNPFGGIITIKASTAYSSKVFTMYTGYNVPSEACMELLQTDYGSNGIFIKIGVDQETSVFVAGTSYPVETSAAISACKGENKMIQWWFK